MSTSDWYGIGHFVGMFIGAPILFTRGLIKGFKLALAARSKK